MTRLSKKIVPIENGNWPPGWWLVGLIPFSALCWIVAIVAILKALK